jgi:hypothetical protein
LNFSFLDSDILIQTREGKSLQARSLIIQGCPFDGIPSEFF